MKMHLDLTVFIGPDLFAFRPHHDGRLRSQSARLAREARWAKWQGGALHGQIEHTAATVMCRLLWRAHGMVVVFFQIIAGVQHHIFAVFFYTRTTYQVEQRAGGYAPGSAA